MRSAIAALYSANPTLGELFAADNTLFNSMELPTDLTTSDISAFLLLKYKTLETIFETAEEAKAGIAVWSSALVGNWTKMWEALQEEYAPLENYSMIEEMTDDETVHEYGKTSTRTDNLTHRKTGTDTTTPDLTDTETPNEATTNNSGIYGFNSATALPDSTATDTRTGTNTRRTTGESETEYNTTDTDTGTQAQVDSGSDTDTRNYTLTRSGNIGVTTSQQMLESEIELRCKWSIYEIIANAFRHDLCISVW